MMLKKRTPTKRKVNKENDNIIGQQQEFRSL